VRQTDRGWGTRVVAFVSHAAKQACNVTLFGLSLFSVYVSSICLSCPYSECCAIILAM
jgi:hypothetical protein